MKMCKRCQGEVPKGQVLCRKCLVEMGEAIPVVDVEDPFGIAGRSVLACYKCELVYVKSWAACPHCQCSLVQGTVTTFKLSDGNYGVVFTDEDGKQSRFPREEEPTMSVEERIKEFANKCVMADVTTGHDRTLAAFKEAFGDDAEITSVSAIDTVDFDSMPQPYTVEFKVGEDSYQKNFTHAEAEGVIDAIVDEPDPVVRVVSIGMPQVSEDFMVRRPIMMEYSPEAVRDLVSEQGPEGLFKAIGRSIVHAAQEHDDKIKVKHAAAKAEIDELLDEGQNLTKDDITAIMKKHKVPGVDPQILMGSVTDLGHEPLRSGDEALPDLLAAQADYAKDQVITNLFDLLDDIDTLSDICKSDLPAYQNAVDKVVKRRWETGITVDRDGQEISLTGMHPIPRMEHERLILTALGNVTPIEPEVRRVKDGVELPPKPQALDIHISTADRPAVGCGKCFMAYPEGTGRCSQCGSADLVPGTITATPPPPEQGYTECEFRANDGGGWSFKEPWTRSEGDPEMVESEDPQPTTDPSAAPVAVSEPVADHVGCPTCELVWDLESALAWPIPPADLKTVDVRIPCPKCKATLQQGAIQGIEPHAECKDEVEVRFFPAGGDHWAGTKVGTE